MAYTKEQGLETYCTTCPPVEEVTGVLHALGLALLFHMDVDRSPAYEQVPPLPAHYHYRDRHGTEVIFLAGHDTDLDGLGLPEHASRFWVYPGADAGAYWWVAHELAERWSLTWQPASQVGREVA